MAALPQLWEPDRQQDKGAIDTADFHKVRDQTLFLTLLFFGGVAWQGGGKPNTFQLTFHRSNVIII